MDMNVGHPQARQCTSCGEWFLDYSGLTSFQTQCETCKMNYGFDTISYTIPFVQIFTGQWNEWNYLYTLSKHFLYKIEDGWYTWTEVESPEDWEKGTIYKTKNFFDFMENVIDFTGARGATASADCAAENT
jgi:hypothetical protein